MRYRDQTTAELRARLSELQVDDPAGTVSEEARSIARVLLLRCMGRPVAGLLPDDPPTVGDLEALDYPMVPGVRLLRRGEDPDLDARLDEEQDDEERNEAARERAANRKRGDR